MYTLESTLARLKMRTASSRRTSGALPTRPTDVGSPPPHPPPTWSSSATSHRIGTRHRHDRAAAFDAISRGPTHGGCECELAQSYDDCPETACGACELGAGPQLPAAARRRRGRGEGLCGGLGGGPLDSPASARQSRPQLGHGREGRAFGGCASGEGFAVGGATSRPHGRPPTSAGEMAMTKQTALCRPQPPRSTRGDLGGRGRHNIGRRPAGRPAHDGAEHTTGSPRGARGCRDHRGAPADRRQDGRPRGPALAAAPVSWCPSTATRLA